MEKGTAKARLVGGGRWTTEDGGATPCEAGRTWRPRQLEQPAMGDGSGGKLVVGAEGDAWGRDTAAGGQQLRRGLLTRESRSREQNGEEDEA
ncbi:hypothetical protein NL676_023131 [Syzygium grande]|nr:hypothetical protein NL676_023131 [Syzygium grande]